jgi:hypothetical protein
MNRIFLLNAIFEPLIVLDWKNEISFPMKSICIREKSRAGKGILSAHAACWSTGSS